MNSTDKTLVSQLEEAICAEADSHSVATFIIDTPIEMVNVLSFANMYRRQLINVSHDHADLPASIVVNRAELCDVVENSNIEEDNESKLSSLVAYSTRQWIEVEVENSRDRVEIDFYSQDIEGGDLLTGIVECTDFPDYEVKTGQIITRVMELLSETQFRDNVTFVDRIIPSQLFATGVKLSTDGVREPAVILSLPSIHFYMSGKSVNEAAKEIVFFISQMLMASKSTIRHIRSVANAQTKFAQRVSDHMLKVINAEALKYGLPAILTINDKLYETIPFNQSFVRESMITISAQAYLDEGATLIRPRFIIVSLPMLHEFTATLADTRTDEFMAMLDELGGLVKQKLDQVATSGSLTVSILAPSQTEKLTPVAQLQDNATLAHPAVHDVSSLEASRLTDFTEETQNRFLRAYQHKWSIEDGNIRSQLVTHLMTQRVVNTASVFKSTDTLQLISLPRTLLNLPPAPITPKEAAQEIFRIVMDKPENDSFMPKLLHMEDGELVRIVRRIPVEQSDSSTFKEGDYVYIVERTRGNTGETTRISSEEYDQLTTDALFTDTNNTTTQGGTNS